MAAGAVLTLAGCAAGPDFQKPAPPRVSAYTRRPLPAETAAAPGVTGGEAQRFQTGAEIAADWWTLFHSPQLDALVAEALKNNPDLAAAQAALKAAHETTLAQKGAFLPDVSAGYSASRQRQSEALAPTPGNNALLYSLFTPQVSVGYTPDVFGLTRRTVENAAAQEEAARFQMLAARLSLTSNVVAAAVQMASLEAQLDATRQTVDLDRRSMEIVRYQQAQGYASGTDLAQQQAQLAQAEAALPGLAKQVEQQRHLIAVLTGRFPNEASEAKFDLAGLALPGRLPVSLPSRLVEQRPDVRQAEANLHAASAAVGVAAANRLPNIQLTGSAGSTALSFDKTFGPGTAFWSYGAALTAPIFEGGALLHQERAAKAAYGQAAAQYRSTVLGAFQNVADTLSAIQRDAETLAAAAKAADAAKATLEITERQRRDGYASELTLLAAQQGDAQARINLVQAQAARYVDTAALFQALGGGWWRAPDLAGKQDARDRDAD